MKQEFQFFQDFIDAVSADTLDSSAESISFPGGWSGVVNKRYESKLSPDHIVGRVIRFQLEAGVPVISRANLISDGICERPPILPIDIVKPGKIFSLKFLSDQIRVFVTGFTDWTLNFHNFKQHIEKQRNNAPHFGICFHERRQVPGTENDGNVARVVKAFATENSYPFSQGLHRDNTVDELLIRLWREFMSKRFPWYQ